MTRNEIERRISDWQGRVIHAERERREALKRGHFGQADAVKWADKHAAAKCTLDALYEMLTECA